MEPNFVRMKVPELKRYLQVWGISVANKRRKELIDLCIKAHELAIEIIDEAGDQMGVSAKLETDDGTVPDPYSLKSDWTTDLSSFPNYTWGDMYFYLIVKEGYFHESLKAFKSLEGALGWTRTESSSKEIDFLWMPSHQVQRETYRKGKNPNRQ